MSANLLILFGVDDRDRTDGLSLAKAERHHEMATLLLLQETLEKIVTQKSFQQYQLVIQFPTGVLSLSIALPKFILCQMPESVPNNG
jgi:hypothetical protein